MDLLILISGAFFLIVGWLQLRARRRDAFAQYIVDSDMLVKRIAAEEWVAMGYAGKNASIDIDASWRKYQSTYLWDYDFANIVVLKGVTHATN